MGRNKPVKKGKWKTAASIAVLAVGLGVLFFPQLHELFYENQVTKLKTEILRDTAMDQSNAANHYLLYQLLKKENETLFTSGQEGLIDAFSYEQPAVDLSDYGIKDNCIGFITIPSIKAELPIYLGANTENMRKGAVHLTQTSYPIGGENTNCVIAAHRGRSVAMFRNIHRIQIGDEIFITNFMETLVYRAVEIKIIKPVDAAEILIQDGRDLITLISCHPLGANHQRYILYCERAL